MEDELYFYYYDNKKYHVDYITVDKDSRVIMINDTTNKLLKKGIEEVIYENEFDDLKDIFKEYNLILIDVFDEKNFSYYALKTKESI